MLVFGAMEDIRNDKFSQKLKPIHRASIHPIHFGEFSLVILLLQFSWQAQHLVILPLQFLWQAQHFSDSIIAVFVAGATLVILSLQLSWQAQHLVILSLQFSWQVQHLVILSLQFSWQAQHLVILSLQFSWHAQHLVTLEWKELSRACGEMLNRNVEINVMLWFSVQGLGENDKS